MSCDTFEVVASVPSALLPPGIPVPIIGFRVIGIASDVVGADVALGGDSDRRTILLLREGRHCQRGKCGDGGNVEKREFGHGCFLLLIVVQTKSRSHDLKKWRAFICRDPRQALGAVIVLNKTKTQAVAVLFRAPDLTTTDGNEPADAKTLNRLVQDPTKETFINVLSVFSASFAGTNRGGVTNWPGGAQEVE
jgi:hypothetical protein